MWDLLINLLASVIAGVAVWAGHRVLRLRELSRKRAFFGVEPGAEVLFFVAKHYSSPRPNSVHRTDVATLIELATSVKECGGQPTLVVAGDDMHESGRQTEYSVGGPIANPRTGAYLRSLLPGVTAELAEGRDLPTLVVGETAYNSDYEHDEFVLLVRTIPPESTRPVFLLIGQTARTNLAAARYLVRNYKRLRREFGAQPRFSLMLRVKEPRSFGGGHVERVADLTSQSVTPIPSPA